MNLNIKLLSGMFWCLLWFQASMIMSYAHSKDKASDMTIAQEATPDMPKVQMGEGPAKEVAENGSDWSDLKLLKLRNDFEAKLLPNLIQKSKTDRYQQTPCGILLTLIF